MGLNERWQRRWAARTAQTVAESRTRIYETAQLRHPPEAVWSLVAPAESSVLLTPDTTAKAFTVPGTGPGVGEQQCHVDHDGQATVIEVVELVQGRRAVTVAVSPRPSLPVRMVTSIEPLEGGCVMAYGVEFDAPAGTQWPKADRDAFREYASAYLDRVRRVLDADTGSGSG